MTYDITNDPEQQDLLLGFVEEGREMIDEVEPLLIELERSSEESGHVDLEMVNTVFRLFHSLKGGAGFLDLNTVSSVTHEAETLLDMFRKGVGQLNSPHIDLMNRAIDFLREILDQIENEFHDRGFETEAEEISQLLKAAIAEIKGEPVESVKEKVEEKIIEEKSEQTVNDNDDIAENENDKSEEDYNLDSMQMLISPEMVKQFVTEAEEQLDRAEQALLSLEQNPSDKESIQQAFREIHSFKGNAGFLGYADLEKLSHGAESVLDRFREGILDPTSKVINLILEIIDFLRGGLNSISNDNEPKIPALPGLLHLLEDYSGTKVEEKKKAEAQVEIIVPVKKKEVKKASEEARDALAQKKKEPEAPVKTKKPVAVKKVPVENGSKNKKKTSSSRQSVRVDVEKLDVLLDLVGELVISEAMVAQNPDLKQIEGSMDRFEKAVMQLDKITRDIQDVATSIRMIPLAGTFRRMVRLVRDLSQKAGKKVDLQIIGEDTEVDKTVIEQITDPLIHIIRNSIDHGLEVPKEREEAGKDQTGRLILEAKYVGGEVWINIDDDGRGLNREKIIKKAEERGLLEKDPSEYTDEQVWQFIFMAGFSTADKITDVSGRGVGMDVVRKNIENIRGKVDMKSNHGKGTLTILKIPLTLAIIDGMLVRVGDAVYTLPITAIKESMQVKKKMITQTMDGQEILRVREELIPVVRLHELLDIEAERKELDGGIVTILENDGSQVCLFVDELLGQQQIVIKGMSEYVGNQNCVSGCTILGDGDISLILDVGGIIDHSKNTTKIAQDLEKLNTQPE